jgi:hypothetical protein
MFLVAISVIVRSLCLAPADVPDKLLRYKVPVLDLAPSKGWCWRGSRRAHWKHGLYSAEVLAEQRRVCDRLSQSRDLLKQMQNGLTNGVTVQGH